jgi:anti-anti-sigma factor
LKPLATLTLEERDGIQIVRVDGEVDLSNAPALLDRLLHAVSNRSHSVILDLSSTGYLDSAGLRLVFEAQRALRERRQGLRIVAPPDTFVADVLAATGLGESVPIDRSLADAVEAVSRPAAEG